MLQLAADDTMPDGYSPKDFAERCGSHVQTVYKWLREHGDVSWKPRGRWLIPESAVPLFQGQVAESSPGLLRFRDAADELDVPRVEIYEWIRLGLIDVQTDPATRRPRIPVAEVRRMKVTKEIGQPITDGKLPILGHVSAGTPLLAEDQIVGWEQVDDPDCPGRFVVIAEGESMVPTIMPGEKLVVVPFNRRRSPKQNTVVIALVDGGHTVKRFLVERRRPILRADNPDRNTYPDIKVTEDVVWIGRVWGVSQGIRRI